MSAERAPERVDASASDVASTVDADGRRATADVPPARPLTPQQRAAANQRRDAVAARIFRDLNLHGGRVESAGGVRDTLRVRAANCSVTFGQDVDRTYHLRGAGFTLVSCTRPDTRDTYQTGASSP